jgi:hypothetical protein
MVICYQCGSGTILPDATIAIVVTAAAMPDAERLEETSPLPDAPGADIVSSKSRRRDVPRPRGAHSPNT